MSKYHNIDAAYKNQKNWVGGACLLWSSQGVKIVRNNDDSFDVVSTTGVNAPAKFTIYPDDTIRTTKSALDNHQLMSATSITRGYAAARMWMTLRDESDALVMMPFDYLPDDLTFLAADDAGHRRISNECYPLTYKIRRRSVKAGNTVRTSMKPFLNWLKTTLTLAKNNISGEMFITCVSPYIQHDAPHYNSTLCVNLQHNFTTPFTPMEEREGMWESNEHLRQEEYGNAIEPMPAIRVSVPNPEVEWHKAERFLNITDTRQINDRLIYSLVTHPDQATDHMLRLKTLMLIMDLLGHNNSRNAIIVNYAGGIPSESYNRRMQEQYNLPAYCITRSSHDGGFSALIKASYTVPFESVKTYLYKLIGEFQKGDDVYEVVTIKASSKINRNVI